MSSGLRGATFLITPANLRSLKILESKSVSASISFSKEPL